MNISVFPNCCPNDFLLTSITPRFSSRSYLMCLQTTAPSTSQLDSTTIRQLQQLQQLLIRQSGCEPTAGTSGGGAGSSTSLSGSGPVPHPDAGLFSSKQLLDFGHGDHHKADDSTSVHANSDVINPITRFTFDYTCNLFSIRLFTFYNLYICCWFCLIYFTLF